MNKLHLHWYLSNPAGNLARAGLPKNGGIPDLMKPQSDAILFETREALILKFHSSNPKQQDLAKPTMQQYGP